MGLVIAALQAAFMAFAAAPPPPVPAAAPGPAEPAWAQWNDLIDRDAVGATAWTKAHPTWDGRGVVVAVLDTGVDPSRPGLTTLPDGSGPKVIEARDFSGEGDVPMRRARVVTEGGVAMLRVDPVAAGKDDAQAGVVRGIDKLGVKPRAGSGYQVGFFSEASQSGSQVTDFDRDGKANSRFAVVAFEREDGVAVAVVDTDGDGDMSDEAVRRSYGDDPQWFAFAARSGDPRDDKPPVAIALWVAPGAREVVLHFDDGGHGSHCAGIAAGHRIDGQSGFDGIAPGARVMSLKIGHNALSGGATTSGAMAEAIRFASAWAREHQTPVVINMSYGIGNERETMGRIDKILDDELQANPWLAAALSAGNEGPGLSNVGMPGSATLAWASAAMLPEAQARTLWGGTTKGKKVFSFSSRGGELDKPDGLAPGVAWSTVPAFETSSVKAGTSMASPQAAGVHALLASAAVASKLPWTNGLAHRALTTGAKPLAGYTSLDQGAGLINVAAAWEAYKREAAAAGGREIAGWRVSTPIPSHPGRTASASYWRVGGYLPEATEAIAFEVTPLLYGDLAESARDQHVETLSLASDVGWLSVDRSSLVVRGTTRNTLNVRLNAAALGDAPGIRVGRIRAKTRGTVAFDLPVVVVVPELFDLENGWTRHFEGSLAAGDVTRVFVMVPPGATAMAAHLGNRGKYGNAWLMAFDPDGHAVEMYEHHASTEDQTSGDLLLAGDALQAGIWELVVYAPYRNRAATAWSLDVDFRALAAPDALTYETSPGGEVSADLALTNGLATPFRGTLEVAAVAIARDRTIDSKDAKTSVPLEVGDGISKVDLVLEVDEDTWDRMTDIAVNITDDSGAIVDQQAFGARRLEVAIDARAGTYHLDFTAGHADPEGAGTAWKVKIHEVHRRASPKAFEVERPRGMARATLFPGVKTSFALKLAGPLPEAPDGFEHRAEVTLTALDGGVWTRFELPLRRD